MENSTFQNSRKHQSNSELSSQQTQNSNPNFLHKQFKKLGLQRHKLLNEMMIILPKIYESGIYKKYASSIFEYASKFGGIPGSTVEKRLRLEKHLADKPALKVAINDVGVHKVAMVATIATAETDKMYADKIKNMSKSAVQILSKEMRQKQRLKKEEVGADLFSTGSDSPAQIGNYPCCAVPERVKVELDEEMTFLFLRLKGKFGKQMSNKQIMKMILEKMVESEFSVKESRTKREKKKKERSDDIQKVVTGECGDVMKSVTGDGLQNKRECGARMKSVTGDGLQNERECGDVMKSVTGDGLQNEKSTRYITAQERRESLAQTNHKCSYPNCNKPAEIFHHADRFSTSRSHESIQPLCRDHHEFAHNGLIFNEKEDSARWEIGIGGKVRDQADVLYRKYRQVAVL
jgi:hypothetical protein